jgi:NADPH-dependent ferric siderophore reductase
VDARSAHPAAGRRPWRGSSAAAPTRRAADLFHHDADPDAATLDIAMLDHDGDLNTVSPAQQWASAISIGDQVRMTRPQGNFVIGHDAPYHVFAGEETASVAFAAMLRNLPPTATVHGVIEGATRADLPSPRPAADTGRAW